MDRELILFGIPPKEIEKCWPKVERPILKALKFSDGKYTLFDIECALKSHEMQLWVVIDGEGKMKAVLITQIATYPHKKVMFFVLIQGVKFEDWQHFIEDFKAFAKSHDCQSIEGYGRPGWEPKILPMGFKKVHTVFSLPI